ncbi:MAG: pyruvate kinase [Cyclobacteriaceae bacterium]|nr:pyruvate kinase [Cyclobacteriaceae bacterium]MCH8514901.1 pyruvate kinase [Cyclobacteriaceae bacterium]
MEAVPFNKTKIVATVGPASNNKEKLRELIKAGVDVFRLNFSHGTHEIHEKVIQMVTELNEEMGTHAALLQDLQGPKIRTGEVENNGVEIKEGDTFIITTEDMVGTSKKVSTSYQSLAKDVVPGNTILIDDGKIELRVIKTDGKDVHTQVVYGGIVKSRKGINLPDANVSAPSLTEKDEEDLKFGLTQPIQWVALSFVRKASDITYIKNIIAQSGKDIRIVAKIEKPEAIANIDEIIEVSDALMVARGDLGVEMPMEEVPLLQKMIIEKCRAAYTPVIVATQMLESMIENPRPTRAETNDVANAVLDGTDAVMLSAETAAGTYPVEAVQSMVKIIVSIEKKGDIYDNFFKIPNHTKTYLNDSLVANACRMASEVNARALIGMTKSGYTGFRLAAHRPHADIFIFTAHKPLLKIISLVWGVRGIYYDKMTTTDDTFNDVEKILVDANHLRKGDIFITTASMPILQKQRTNMFKVNVAGGTD